MKKVRLPVCFSSDNKYAPYLGVTITSIFKNKHEGDNFHFYILDGGISEENKVKIRTLCNSHGVIEFITVDKSLFSDCPIFENDRLSLATYYRIILPDICPRENKLIYLDCDIIVTGSLRDMLNIDLCDSYIGGIIDSAYKIGQARMNVNQYINAGVLLINAKKWRDDKVTDMIFTWIKNNKHRILRHDQDTLNAALENKVMLIDNKWNAQLNPNSEIDIDYIKLASSAVILHYVCKKPWKVESWQETPYTNTYLHYLRQSPWRQEYCLYLLKLPGFIIKHFAEWVFAIKNTVIIDKKYKIVQFFGFPVIKFERKPKNSKAL